MRAVKSVVNAILAFASREQVLAAPRKAMHPQKIAKGHRSLLCDFAGAWPGSFCVLLCFLWMYFGMVRARWERVHRGDSTPRRTSFHGARSAHQPSTGGASGTRLTPFARTVVAGRKPSLDGLIALVRRNQDSDAHDVLLNAWSSRRFARKRPQSGTKLNGPRSESIGSVRAYRHTLSQFSFVSLWWTSRAPCEPVRRGG